MINLLGLNQSLWLDEAITVSVSRLSLSAILTQFSPHDFHPPLYYFFLHLWTLVFGFSEIFLRLPSAIFVLVSSFLVYKISRNKWAAIIFLCNPLIIYYSQEARMYAMATMLLLFSLHFFLQKKYFLFNLFIFLSFLTFYGTVFFILSLFIYALIKRTPKNFFILLPGFILAVILISPLLLSQLSYSKIALHNVTNWSNVLGRITLKNLALIPLKFTLGRIGFYPKIAYYLIGTIATIFVFTIFIKNIIKDKLLLILFFSPLAIALVFSIFSPMFQYFRFLYLIPILCIGLAKSKKLKFFVLFIFLISSLIYLFVPSQHREDWKGVLAAIPQNSSIALIPSFGDPITYYRPDLKIIDIRNLPSNMNNFFVIPYAEDAFGYNHLTDPVFKKYTQVSHISFRQISLEQWQKTL